jgi:phosphatidylinositol alpha 1,6-mannosyltransferase
MRRFRIVIFTGNYNHIRDGVSLTLNRLVNFLLERDIEVLVFAPTIKEPALEHSGELFPVPSISLPGRPEYRGSTGLPAKAKKRLKEFNPDIVHIATPDVLGFKSLRWAQKTPWLANGCMPI